MYKQPPYSCPSFDAAIEHIEEARRINSRLRDDNCTISEEIEELKQTISRLEDTIADLEQTIHTLESIIAEARRAA